MSNSMDTDYGSDIEGFDVAAGYMSDGDILRSSHVDDINSGYMSEGGASLYAKRMQQRFREGIMAVKECMQNSSGMPDDERYVINIYIYIYIYINRFFIYFGTVFCAPNL
jgi:neuron navigator 2